MWWAFEIDAGYEPGYATRLFRSKDELLGYLTEHVDEIPRMI